MNTETNFETNFDWSQTEILALAKESCTQCQGFGLRRSSRKGPASPCNCVMRGIFKACYARFRHCAQKEKHMSTVRLEQVPGGRDRRMVWGRKDEEYVADFCLISRRVLDEEEYRIFKFHYLLGADWKLCCRRLNMDRGSFFHAVYRIQQKLGRVFRELQPYALYPLDEYFGGTVRCELPQERRNLATMPTPEPKRHGLVPPLRKVA
jgi:hypothetical protein